MSVTSCTPSADNLFLVAPTFRETNNFLRMLEGVIIGGNPARIISYLQDGRPDITRPVI